MSHHLLNAHDRKLLSFILGLHAEDGPIERSQLSVKARGAGIEVARSLLTLKNRGLVEEITKRPGALRRFFGAKTLVLVGPTEAGLELGTETGRDTAVSTGTKADEDLAVPDTQMPTGGAPGAAPETAPPAAPQTMPAADRKPAMDPPPQPPAMPEPRPRPAAAPASVAAPAAPRASGSRPRLDAFTEDLGGAPEDNVMPVGVQVAPDVMDGLRETLVLHDMELTTAGEVLIADRMAKGASQGEALCQVVLYAFAHAVHLAALGGIAFRPGALKDYAVGVMRALEALRDSGEIRDDRFEQDMRDLWALINGGPDALHRAEALLSDPIGGMAPTAVLPEEMLLSEDIEAEPF